MKARRKQTVQQDAVVLDNAAGVRVLSLDAERVSRYRHAHARLTNEQPLSARLGLVASLRQEGVTTTLLEMAAVMAHDWERTWCVIETNVYWPGLASRMGIEGAPGLVQAVMEQAVLDDVLNPTGMGNLWVLPAGSDAGANLSRMVRSRSMQDIVRALGERFDHILLDIPALLATEDALPLASLADELVLLVRRGVTPVPQIRRALDQIEHLTIRGVILDGDRTSIPRWLLSWLD